MNLFPGYGVDRIMLYFTFCWEQAYSIIICQFHVYWENVFQTNLSVLTWEHIFFYFVNSTSTKKVSDADSAHKAPLYTCQAASRFL